ncbi:MAG: restriction endonuclease subunit S [Leptospira bouyouniensis]
MKPKEKTSLKQMVPELRFPEFADAGDWVERPVGKVYSFIVTNSLSRDQLNYISGEFKNIHYGDIHTKFSTLFDITKERVPYVNEGEALNKIKSRTTCEPGDIIFADASEDLADIGKSIEVVNLNNEKLISGLHTIHSRPVRETFVIGFGGYLFKSPKIRSQIQRIAQGAKVLGISASKLSLIPIPIPSLPEQQKIADCLSSLDEVISLESQKLQSLQSYKKGLLQNLFPGEGETVPKLRFQEFVGAGDWEERKLGDVCDVQDGFAFKSFDFVDSAIGNVQVIRITDINNLNKNTSKVYVSNSLIAKNDLERYFVEKGDLLLSLTGAAGFNFFIWDGSKSLINQRTSKITPKDKSNLALRRLIEPLVYYKINFQGEGQNNNLSKEFLLDVDILLPFPPEQEKIADCLSSVDALIQEQLERVEGLKSHKKGLLQGLFPVMGE